MIINRPGPLDCPVEDRCWTRYEGGIDLSEKGVWQLYTRARHNALFKANKKNASAMMATTNIDGETTDWLTVFSDEDDEKRIHHEEITDYLTRRPSDAGTKDPISEFFVKTEGAEYQGVLHYDTHPRKPLQTDTEASEQDNNVREHTLASDTARFARESEYDHLIVTVIRPLVISERDTSIDEPEGIWETVCWPAIRKYALDCRPEGELTGNDYYVQMYEIIAYTDTQQAPSRPAIAEATANLSSKHNFEYEFVSVEMLLKKLRRAQTDVRQSRTRRMIPKLDGKKRARAVSKQDLRQFLMHTID